MLQQGLQGEGGQDRRNAYPVTLLAWGPRQRKQSCIRSSYRHPSSPAITFRSLRAAGNVILDTAQTAGSTLPSHIIVTFVGMRTYAYFLAYAA